MASSFKVHLYLRVSANYFTALDIASWKVGMTDIFDAITGRRRRNTRLDAAGTPMVQAESGPSSARNTQLSASEKIAKRAQELRQARLRTKRGGRNGNNGNGKGQSDCNCTVSLPILCDARSHGAFHARCCALRFIDRRQRNFVLDRPLKYMSVEADKKCLQRPSCSPRISLYMYHENLT